jgi:L-lysine exporter family protein LysE/ArgO
MPPVTGVLIGFTSSMALIVAIGAQNAYVLRQGLRREHVLPIIAVCTGADALLIAAGVAGMGVLISGAPELIHAVRYGGALFLLTYAALAARRALRPGRLSAQPGGPGVSVGKAVAVALGFTFLNPHVYLDTVVLLGAMGAEQPGDLRVAFVIGGALASVVWFVTLGYGARLLEPLFARPVAWRVLDGSIAVVMTALAALLLLG